MRGKVALLLVITDTTLWLLMAFVRSQYAVVILCVRMYIRRYVNYGWPVCRLAGFLAIKSTPGVLV